MTKQITCIISGRVQGVLFRDFTFRNAKKISLTGTVENLSDGAVKVVAQGEEDKLNIFLEKLKKGSLLSKVEDIKIEWSEGRGEFKDFKIVYHGFLDHF